MTTGHRRQPPLTAEQLQSHWADLNRRFFGDALLPIAVEWSARLTSSVGLFSSLVGPRTPAPNAGGARRLIRLSLPILSGLADASEYAEQEIVNTLAHEMIHQWQYDVLKRRPGHGVEFLRKMTDINKSGLVGITLYHRLDEQVRALAQYRWRCRHCGRDYRRTRRTIHTQRHRCGACRGPLVALSVDRQSPGPEQPRRVQRQLTLAFAE
jgi:hypothetical protein